MTELAEKPLQYFYDTALPPLLFSRRLSLVITTYRSNRLVLLSSPDGVRLNGLLRRMDQPAGLAFHGRGLALSTKREICFYEPAGTVREPNGAIMPYDFILAPRRIQVTGDINSHDLAWAGDDLLIVNTRYSCVCRLSPDWSFVPGWKPPFVKSLAPEDRCHFNGFAVDETGVRYATAFGVCDEKGGWREGRLTGGILMEVPSGRIVVSGLGMPHSPRLHEGRLFFCESANGALEEVDPDSGERREVALLSGFTRGLSFHAELAAVGMSACRKSNEKADLPVKRRVEKMMTGVALVDWKRGELLGNIEFEGIQEVYDVTFLHGPQAPHVLGQDDATLDAMIVMPTSALG